MAYQPQHDAVPPLKIAAGPPQHANLITPRSLAAAEKACIEQELLAMQAEEGAALASARAMESGTPEAATEAKAALAKAAVADCSVRATMGRFLLVCQRAWWFQLEVHPSEHAAREAAATLWSGWILYHEQRGSCTELAHGGISLSHASIRRHMTKAQKRGLDTMMGGARSSSSAPAYPRMA
jgi:hypothetical protein